VVRKEAFAISRLAAEDSGYVFDIASDYPNVDDLAKVTIADFLGFGSGGARD